MKADAVEAVDVIRQFQFQLLNDVKILLLTNSALNDLKVDSATALSKGQPFMLNDRWIEKASRM